LCDVQHFQLQEVNFFAGVERMEEVRELNIRLLALEEEVRRFQQNCQAMQEYQTSLLSVCEVWSKWLGNAAALSQVEGRILTDTASEQT